MRIYVKDRKRWRRIVFFFGWACYLTLIIRLSGRDSIDLSRFVDMILFGFVYLTAMYIMFGER